MILKMKRGNEHPTTDSYIHMKPFIRKKKKKKKKINIEEY